VSSAADTTIGIRLYGVSLNVRCDHVELLDYLTRLLPGLHGAPDTSPDVEVTGHWITDPPERGESLFPDATDLETLGKRMYIGDDDLVWFKTGRDRDLQLRFRQGDASPRFDVAYCYRPTDKKLAQRPNLKYRKFFDLLRYLVYYPAAWHLERTRGWTMIHAAAVGDGSRAILIGGPGGSGKTTTALALVANAGMTLLSENLVFCDGTRIYPLPEPLRLDDDSLALLGDGLEKSGGLEPLDAPGSKSKSMYWLDRPSDDDGTAPALVFIPQFSARGYVRALEPAAASERLAAVNRLTLEVNDYYWYTAALDMLWPEPGNARRQLEALEQLTSVAPCYTLGIDRRAGIAPVVENVLGCLPHSATPLQEANR